jgi:hypothetical protein
MPRISDAFLDCVIYFYASEADAEDGLRTGGSGFLIGVQTTGLSTNIPLVYAVTNRHIIADDNLVVRMRTKDGKHSIGATEPTAWHCHPKGDDLSVSLIWCDWQSMRYNFVPRDRFIDKDIIKRFNIGPGDEVFVVGRFVNHEGRQQNLPTARFGCLAQLPWEPVKQDTGFEQESFLVEARSIAGYSGAPVFLSIPEFSLREGADDWYPPKIETIRPDASNTKSFDDIRKALSTNAASMASFAQKDWGYLRSHGPWLLGVDWGHLNDWEFVRDQHGRPVNPDPRAMRVKMNTGMMTVVPAWKLAELLDDEPVAKQRAEIIEQIRDIQANSPATSD